MAHGTAVRPDTTSAPPLRAADLAAATPATRDRTIDFLRAASIAIVVLGHWLMAAVSFHDGRFEATNILAVVPALAVLTWVVQVMPLFFFVGGFANAVTLDAYRRRGASAGEFVASRVTRLLKPVLVLLAVWVPAALVLRAFGVPADQLARTTRLVCQPLWFLAVYVLVVAAAPAMLTLHRHHGARVPVVLAVSAVVVDVLRFAGEVPFVGWANLAFVWLFAQQLGFHDAEGAFARAPRSWCVRIAAAAVGTLALLVSVGPYPASMVGLSSDRFSNMAPPTICLLAVTVLQVALVTLARPALARWLERPGPWTAVVAANGVVMTVFLWHLTALLLTVVVAFPLGFPQPEPASAAWWATRPLWVALVLVPLAGFVLLFGSRERPRPPAPGATRPLQQTRAYAAAGAAGFGLGGLASAHLGNVTRIDGVTSGRVLLCSRVAAASLGSRRTLTGATPE
jgi:fucose 4-O-acetylase-like acetyltransferase